MERCTTKHATTHHPHTKTQKTQKHKNTKKTRFSLSLSPPHSNRCYSPGKNHTTRFSASFRTCARTRIPYMETSWRGTCLWNGLFFCFFQSTCGIVFFCARNTPTAASSWEKTIPPDSPHRVGHFG